MMFLQTTKGHYQCHHENSAAQPTGRLPSASVNQVQFRCNPICIQSYVIFLLVIWAMAVMQIQAFCGRHHTEWSCKYLADKPGAVLALPSESKHCFPSLPLPKFSISLPPLFPEQREKSSSRTGVLLQQPFLLMAFVVQIPLLEISPSAAAEVNHTHCSRSDSTPAGHFPHPLPKLRLPAP